MKFAATILVFVFTAFIGEKFAMPLQCPHQKEMKKIACHEAGGSVKECYMNKPANKQKQNNPKNCSDCPLSVQLEI